MSQMIMNQFENTINQIRDILRKEGITGMDSIKHCLLFMFMKVLDNNKCKLLDIDQKYSFEQINNLDHNEIKSVVFVKGNPNCLVNQLKKKNIFSMEFKLQSNENIKTIIGKIANIKLPNYHLKLISLVLFMNFTLKAVLLKL